MILLFCVSIASAACRSGERRWSPTHPALNHVKRWGRGVHVTWSSSYLQRIVRTRPSRQRRDQSLFYRLRPVVVGTRSSDGGGGVGGGGCRVVSAGWSSYPTGVLRARTYPSGHVVLVVVR